MTDQDPIARYKELVEELLALRKAGALDDHGEAAHAERQEELWLTLTEQQQDELEDWIDERVNGDDE